MPVRVTLWWRAALLIPVIASLAGCPRPVGPGAPDAESTLDAGSAPDAGPVQPDLEALTQPELTRLVTYLASDELEGRDEGTPGSQKARAFIIDQLTRCGLKPAGTSGFEQPIVAGIGTNILARVPGTDPSLEGRTVIISAHYDHLGRGPDGIYNGANDNAAGVAAIIGVGCALAKTAPRRTVLIAAWDAEEPPTFLQAPMGSRYFVENPTVPLGSIDVAIVLDLVGAGMWPGYDGHFLIGAETSDEVAGAVAQLSPSAGLSRLSGGLHLIERTPLGTQQPWSDYDSFRDHDLPVLFLSDGQNKRYHSVDDDVSGLDLAKLALEARSLLELTWSLANASRTPVFKPEGASDLTDARTVVAVLEDALAADGLPLSAPSRTRLESDLVAARTVEAKAAAGTALTSAELRTLRTATQRVMCHAGPQYAAAFCNAF